MNNNTTEICVDMSKCPNHAKYQQEGKKYCLVCSRNIETNTKEASDETDGIFKHASCDL